MIVALIIGVVLAVGSLIFVLEPVFFGVKAPAPVRSRTNVVGERDVAIAALREIEFDRATGKLSESDYAELKGRYTQQAVDAMRRNEGVTKSARPTDAELEAAVAEFRGRRIECADCGPRSEPDACFCSNCGRCLRDRCADCGAPVNAREARYCVNCGSTLAA